MGLSLVPLPAHHEGWIPEDFIPGPNSSKSDAGSSPSRKALLGYNPRTNLWSDLATDPNPKSLGWEKRDRNTH